MLLEFRSRKDGAQDYLYGVGSKEDKYIYEHCIWQVNLFFPVLNTLSNRCLIAIQFSKMQS